MKFGNDKFSQDVDTLKLLIPALILGVVGGAAGSLFIAVNTKTNALCRAKILTKNWMKPIETFLWSFATVTVFYWLSRATT